jgi:hypothetical protein
MVEVKRYRKIPKEVMAVQITNELLDGKVPEGFKDKFKNEIVINPASRQVLLYGKGRKSVTGYLSDWITMDEVGYLAIIPHANFIDNYDEHKVPGETADPNTGQVPTADDPGDGDNDGGDDIAA